MIEDDITLTPHADTLVDGATPPPGIRLVTRSAFVDKESVSQVLQVLAEVGASEEGSPLIAVRSVGGAISRVPDDATAYAHRQAELMFVTTIAGPEPVVEAARPALEAIWERLAPRLLPPDNATPSLVFWTMRDTSNALAVALLGLAFAVGFVVLGPGLARLQAWPGQRLLAPTADTDLSLRLAQLSATRAAALDAHATELRRIERSLHDGTQNRLVAVTVLLGATRRALARDPSGAEAMLERAQDAAEQALAELRTVVRGILPPVLADRGLAGALAGLAANCGVPCRTDIDVPGRCAASVEATTYFVAAEALTNIAKHSQARHATVTVRRQGDRLSLRVEDDGVGAAEEHKGSGLTGIRRRIEAHDGRLTLTSPPGGPTVLQVELPCGL